MEVREMLETASGKPRADHLEDGACSLCCEYVPMDQFCAMCGATFIGSSAHKERFKDWYAKNRVVLAEFGFN